jgi:hypothetical protein
MVAIAKVFAVACIVAIFILARIPAPPTEPGHVREIATCSVFVQSLCDALGNLGGALDAPDNYARIDQ